MDIGAILRSAWRITSRHKLLWILGFLMALPGSCGAAVNVGNGNRRPGSMGGGSRGDGSWLDSGAMDRLPPALRDYAAALAAQAQALSDRLSDAPEMAFALLLLVGGVFGLLLLILSILSLVARVALYRSIDRIDGGGAPPSLRQALALGWSMRTLRLLLLEVLVGFCMVLLFLPILLVGFLPLILGDGRGGRWPEILAALAGICLGLLLLAALGFIVGLLKQFWTCEIAIADRPIGAALAKSVAILRSRPLSIGLLAITVALISLGLGVAIAVAGVLMGLMGLILAVGIGGLLNGLVGGLLGAYATLITLGLGILLATMILALPVAALVGWLQAFGIAVWTLAWRSLTGRDVADLGPPPGEPVDSDPPDSLPDPI